MNKDFLLEIGTEELPPKEIARLAVALANNLEKNLQNLALTFDEAKVFSTPRRLAVLITDLIDKQPDQKIARKGPSVEIAFDKAGKPTVAATKFASSCGANVGKLKKVEEKNKVFLMYEGEAPGKNTTEILPEIIIQSIKKLPLKKPMYWEEKKGPFPRPVHWVLALFGKEIIKLELFSIAAANKTFGHRFHHPEAITIPEPKQYEKLLLEKGRVIVDAVKREQKIKEEIQAKTKEGEALIPDDLLAEVVNLVEWPVALAGTFDKRFLKIPEEVLITTLKTHQRYFPVIDKRKKLLPNFIVISNIESSDPQQVIVGNEKVIHARLHDAEYFYEEDLKEDFAKNLNKLKTVTFQEKLGSLYDKTMRLKKLAPFIAGKIGAPSDSAKRAAELAKCDLVTSMVWEFPELEGVMGQYYAKQETKGVTIALKEQYLPRFAKDKVPETLLGTALALTDRIDNLVGFFGIGKIPTGDKDPFGLRRDATGIISIILEKNLQLDLKELFAKSLATYGDIFKNKDELISKLMDFVYDRLRYFYTEQNRNVTVFRAVLACMPEDIQDFGLRFEAVDSFIRLPEAGDLIEIYKRIKNILSKSDLSQKTKLDAKLIKQNEEKALGDTLKKETKIIQGLYQNKKYSELLEELIKFKNPLDDFFTNVMVMDKNTKIRNNRLALLQDLQKPFLLIADLSYLISG